MSVYVLTVGDSAHGVSGSIVLTLSDTQDGNGQYAVTAISGTFGGFDITGLNSSAGASQTFSPDDVATNTQPANNSFDFAFTTSDTGAFSTGEIYTTPYVLYIRGDPTGGGSNGRFDTMSVAAGSTCYTRGTRILTPRGEVPVEQLAAGDLVATRLGGFRPIRWIGSQSFDARFVADGDGLNGLPIRIAAGALGEQTPCRDLVVSPGHSMLIDGALIVATLLVNGVTVTREPASGDIHYFHIELDTHDCVLADGAWSETYADVKGMRARFHHADGAPSDVTPPITPLLCAPRPMRGAALEAAMRPAAARAQHGRAPGPLRGSVDLAADGRVQGWAQDRASPELPVLLEILAGDTVLGEILACDPREDLLKAGIAHGNFSFDFAVPNPDEADFTAGLTVRRASDGAELPLSPACRHFGKTQDQQRLSA